MTDFTVKSGTTARLGKVDGELRVGRNARIEAESGRKVVVAGGAHFEGPVTIDCDFECASMRVEGRGFGPGGDVVVKGSLQVRGDLEIDAATEVQGDISAGKVDIGGHLKSGSISSKGVRVGGHMEVRGELRAEDVDVGGHLTVEKQVEIANLRVGGHAEVAGGTIKGEIRVRGHFKTAGKLNYGTIQVFGQLRLPSGCRGERLVALGKVECDGDTYAKTFEVNGAASIRGNCSAETLRTKGKLDVDGSLKASERLEVLGSIEVREEVECGQLASAGRLKAERVQVKGNAEVAGQAWTASGLKAREVSVGTGSRVNGPIIAEKVDVGKGVDTGGFWAQASGWRSIGGMTRVDDVYGNEVMIERYSQAKRVYGEKVRMQPGSMADEVGYTREADISDGVHLGRPLRKLDRLPGAPP